MLLHLVLVVPESLFRLTLVSSSFTGLHFALWRLVCELLHAVLFLRLPRHLRYDDVYHVGMSSTAVATEAGDWYLLLQYLGSSESNNK